MTADLLPQNATPLELAFDAVSADRWGAFDVDVVRRFRDPWTCPAHMLNFLAYERSVDIWDTDWSEEKKRSVIASAPADHRKKGTLGGVRRYVEIAGGEIVQTVTPPEGVYAAPDLSAEQWQTYLDRQPRLRIKLARGTDTWTAPLGHFADHAYSDEDCVDINKGAHLRARQAVLRERKGAADQPIQIRRVEATSETRTGVLFEQVIRPADDPLAIFAGEGFYSELFAEADEVAQRTYSFAIDRAYKHREAEAFLDTVPVGYEPRDTRYYRESETAPADEGHFSDDALAADMFVTADIADDLLADVLYLHNPEVNAPLVDGGNSYADHCRSDFPLYTAQMIIRLDEKGAQDDTYAGRSFIGEMSATEEVHAARDRVSRSVRSSKSLRDQILYTHQTLRPRTLADGFSLKEGQRLGGYVANAL
ncbi:phage tail protein I [Sulfitobacter sp. 1A15106]|uniref:phage tail protein I n=1 Tax=Sulfitobacter sp. 1A15106 TaxID=3368590 RepID=UPI0037450D26